MKFRYKILAVFLKWGSAYLCGMFLAYLMVGGITFDNSGIKSFNKSFYFFVAFSAFYVIEELKKYIEIFNDHVYFNLFKFKKIKFMKSSSFGVRYEDILSVESKFLPVLGLYAIIINAKNIPEKIKISFGFRKHRKLYSEIVKRAKKHNPNAYIDSKLEDYLEKRGLLEEI